jgi:hypothetical protein
VPLPSIVPPKLLTPEDIGKTPNKALSVVAASPTSSSASMTKKEKKKALLKAMIESYKEDDSSDEDTTSSFSANVPDPQKDYFGNSGFAHDDVPGLEDL